MWATGRPTTASSRRSRDGQQGAGRDLTDQGPVGELDPLGLAGGARRVEERGEVVRARRGRPASSGSPPVQVLGRCEARAWPPSRRRRGDLVLTHLGVDRGGDRPRPGRGEAQRAAARSRWAGRRRRVRRTDPGSDRRRPTRRPGRRPRVGERRGPSPGSSTSRRSPWTPARRSKTVPRCGSRPVAKPMRSRTPRTPPTLRPAWRPLPLRPGSGYGDRVHSRMVVPRSWQESGLELLERRPGEEQALLARLGEAAPPPRPCRRRPRGRGSRPRRTWRGARRRRPGGRATRQRRSGCLACRAASTIRSRPAPGSRRDQPSPSRLPARRRRGGSPAPSSSSPAGISSRNRLRRVVLRGRRRASGSRRG